MYYAPISLHCLTLQSHTMFIRRNICTKMNTLVQRYIAIFPRACGHRQNHPQTICFSRSFPTRSLPVDTPQMPTPISNDRATFVLQFRSTFFAVGYILMCSRPASHSSDASINTALAKRRQESSFGKRQATLVRRFTSRLSRSSTLLARVLRRCSSGRSNTVNPSSKAVSAHAASFDAV